MEPVYKEDNKNNKIAGLTEKGHHKRMGRVSQNEACLHKMRPSSHDNTGPKTMTLVSNNKVGLTSKA